MNRNSASPVLSLEKRVKKLKPRELAEFREWFLDYEWQAWDRELESDVRAGRLDALADEAIAHHKAGRTKSL